MLGKQFDTANLGKKFGVTVPVRELLVAALVFKAEVRYRELAPHQLFRTFRDLDSDVRLTLNEFEPFY